MFARVNLSARLALLRFTIRSERLTLTSTCESLTQILIEQGVRRDFNKSVQREFESFQLRLTLLNAFKTVDESLS